ncbi:MAG: 50S ribosomal protein L19 [Proteobacteria bacterium]|nr:50S ribosomal protein L19 [Cystobacterineae bacterium]MCL2259059.1 50S ribosomal protein L19 [Cystobacterineae bacterium]MCL2314591.1 50S ribosomal protein L19 [Pseudomonadota bacterium]
MGLSAIEFVDSRQLRKDVNPLAFKPGDTVRVLWRIREGEKERTQAFEGVVICKTRGSLAATFTVRKVSYGVGVERIFPLHSPRYESIQVLSRGAVRRSRLFYLRKLSGKAARIETVDEVASKKVAITGPKDA